MSRINTNVSSLVAVRVLNSNNTSLQTSLQRLSTGYRINSGKDDPAGLIASPAHLKRLPDMLDWTQVRGNLRTLFSSGGPLPLEALQACRALLGQAPVEVYGNQFSVSDPEWITNSRTLVFGGYGRQVAIDDLGPGEYDSVPWMVPNGDMGDGELTRDGTKLAVTSEYGANKKIAFFAVKNLTDYPDFVCAFTQGDERYADPVGPEFAQDSIPRRGREYRLEATWRF